MHKIIPRLVVALALSTPAAAEQMEDYPDYQDPPEQEEPVRPLGGNYYDNGGGSGQGWQNYTGGHSCYTSTVNGYSVTSCN